MIPFDDTLSSAAATAIDTAGRVTDPTPAVDSLLTAQGVLQDIPEVFSPVPQVDTLSAADRAVTLWGWLSDWTDQSLNTLSSTIHSTATELFGAASTLVGGEDLPSDAFPELLTHSIAFQVAVLLLAAFYLLLLYTNASEVRMLIDGFSFDSNVAQRTLGKQGIVHSHFLRRCCILGVAGLGVLIVKLCDELLPAGVFTALNPLWRELFGFGAVSVVGAVVLLQTLVMWSVGQVTLSQSFVSMLFSVKQVHFSLMTLVCLPFILLFVLCPGSMGWWWMYLTFIVVALAALLYLREIHSLFILKNISNLHWFLYLCTIEIAPVTFAVLMLIKHS